MLFMVFVFMTLHEIDAPAASADLVKCLKLQHKYCVGLFWDKHAWIDVSAANADLLKTKTKEGLDLKNNINEGLDPKNKHLAKGEMPQHYTKATGGYLRYPFS